MTQGFSDPGPAIRAVGRELAQQISSVNHSVNEVSSELGSVKADLTSTRTDLLELRQRFEEYVVQAERTANVQRSETVLGNVEADLEREYGHYKVVRRTSIGTLQAFDIGNVTNRTVQQVSEELMLQTPRYWLAPALVALAAWSRDDEELSTKSVDAAFSRDPAKTGLFFALILRRQGRMESATRWLRHYLASLDPRSLGREFAIILEATAQDAFGTHGREMVGAQLVEWNRILRADPSVTAHQVQVWQDEIAIHRGTLDESHYPHLSRVTPQWSTLKNLLEHASAHGNVIDKYQAVRDTPIHLNPDLADRLDDILETLVTEYDTEELPFARDVIYHRAVIDHNGDLARAKEEADALSTALDETLDLVTLQTQIALRPELLGASVSTQQVAIGVGRDDFGQGIAAYCAKYRQGYLADVDILLDNQHTNFAVTLGFGNWQTNTRVPQAEAEQSLAQAWANAVAEYLERVRFKPINYAIAAAVVVAVTIVGFLMGPEAGVVLMLLAAAGAGGWVFLKKQKADKLYQEAIAMRDQALRASVDVYRGAMAEFVDAKIAYQEEDERSAELTKLVQTWPTTVGRREEMGIA